LRVTLPPVIATVPAFSVALSPIVSEPAAWLSAPVPPAPALKAVALPITSIVPLLVNAFATAMFAPAMPRNVPLLVARVAVTSRLPTMLPEPLKVIAPAFAVSACVMPVSDAMPLESMLPVNVAPPLVVTFVATRLIRPAAPTVSGNAEENVPVRFSSPATT
jgi:hypothetical protein